MQILVLIITVNHNTVYDEVRHTFAKPKPFEFCMNPHTIEMMLDDIKLTLDDVQILDDMEYNIFSKTLRIRAKSII